MYDDIIPFEKIVTLLRSKQSGMQGQYACVPSYINCKTNLLPVPAGESNIVPVVLQRRLVIVIVITKRSILSNCRS